MDMQSFLVVEKELLAELPSLYKAIVALIAVYGIFTSQSVFDDAT